MSYKTMLLRLAVVSAVHFKILLLFPIFFAIYLLAWRNFRRWFSREPDAESQCIVQV